VGPANPVGSLTRQLQLDGQKSFITGVTISGVKEPGPISGETGATGIVTGYAIDATTLGTTNHRVGTLTLDLAQYNKLGFDVFAGGADQDGNCVLDATITSPCLNKVITAKYNPLPEPDGLGPTDFSVEGFLWLEPADSPYNY
jgi:hypothetical protein